MKIKTKMMVLIVCILILSCKSFTGLSYSQQMKEIYLYIFKLTYFKKLLLIGYNNSPEIKEVILTDQSGFSEIILTPADYLLIDSLVRIDNSILVQDSLNRIGRVAEGAEGKRIISYALEKYQSRWLDKLAKQRYKASVKGSSE